MVSPGISFFCWLKDKLDGTLTKTKSNYRELGETSYWTGCLYALSTREATPEKQGQMGRPTLKLAGFSPLRLKKLVYAKNMLIVY